MAVMSQFPEPGQPVVEPDVTTSPPGASGLFFGTLHLVLGGLSVALAVNEGFAAGVAAFAEDVWRIAFGVVGAGIAGLGLRGLVRTLGGSTRTLTADVRRRARANGRAIFVIGLWFLLCVLADGVGRNSVSFDSWAEPAYALGGVYLMLGGLGLQLDPTKSLRRNRVQQGDGLHGTATIVRANDTGASVNDAPQVKIDFEIDVNGRVTQASDKIVMQRAKLALLIPGSTVDVVVDRADPAVFHVDWDSWRAPAG